ncbi:MAG: hypothetical protein ACI9K2_002064 [Myxococcota bacterium]|jgi:hypothetical protein
MNPLLASPRRPSAAGYTLRMWLTLTAVAALGHPFQPSAWSMRTSVKAEADNLHVVVALEAPTFVVLRSLVDTTGATTSGFNKAEVEKAVDDFNDATWARLANGLTVTIDDVPADLRFAPVDTPINGRANDKFFLYLVEAHWPIPADHDAVSVAISNAAYPDEPMYLTAAPTARAPWTVDASSTQALLRTGECDLDEATPGDGPGTADEPVDVDENGEVWLRDERLRRLDVVFSR